MSLKGLGHGCPRMLREPPQGRGFGVRARLKAMSLREPRMIRRPGFNFGRDALGDGGLEESVDKRVGQTGDKTSQPKPWGLKRTTIF